MASGFGDVAGLADLVYVREAGGEGLGARVRG